MMDKDGEEPNVQELVDEGVGWLCEENQKKKS